MVSGTAVIMWMGELITDRGVGNGMSVLMFTSILAVIPGEIGEIYAVKRFFYAAAAVLVIVAVTTLIVFIEQGQRRLPVQYAKRIAGRRVYGGGSTFIPVKVNQAGVVPVIFASSLLELPQLAVSLFGNQHHPQGWVNWVSRNLDPALAHRAVRLLHWLLLPDPRVHVLLRVDHVQPGRALGQHQELRRLHPRYPAGPAHLRLPQVRAQPAHRPGLRLPGPGRDVPAGSAGQLGLGQDLQLSGVSLLIMAGVGLDTVKQVQSQLEQHSYEGFLR